MANEGIDIGAPERAAQASVVELFDQTLGYEYLGNKTDTENYNIMYGYGGIRLMTYNYDDEAWAKYVADQGGTLSYN